MAEEEIKNIEDSQPVIQVVTKSYTRDQILKSKKYMHKVDLIRALLDKSETYSLQEVDTIIDKFLKGDVK